MNIDPLYILNANYRCKYEYGLSPFEKPNLVSKLSDDALNQKKEEYKELISMTKFFMTKLLAFLEKIPTVIFITDDNGGVIESFGDELLLNSLNLGEGLIFNEKISGTNSVTLSLAHKQPIQVVGKQHFFHMLHGYSCSTCPFSLTDCDKTSGTITLMTTVDNSSPFHLGLVSSAVDSIERELKLRDTNQRLSLLNQMMISSIKNGIVITDNNGIIIDFNATAEEILSVKKSEIIGDKIENYNDISCILKKVIQNQEEFQDVEHTFSNGKTCIIDAFPLYSESNRLEGGFIQFRDITERRKLEDEIIASEKFSAIGKLSAGLAHEIRNPLTPIMGFVKLVMEKHKEDIKTEQYLTLVLNELRRVKKLVDDFVIVSKPETPSKELINIKTLIDETTNLMQSQFLLHNASIEINNQLEEEIFLKMDGSQIKQVLINLIQNALDAIEEKGKITISLMKVNLEVVIVVEDNGAGIEDTLLAKLFNPFFSTKEEGIGLGLSICYRIIQNHQGDITVHSTLGEGTTFKIYLPLNESIETEDIT
ncbi:ATP-binding protein [Bacillus solimangrovi]|uniref:histidine kinase n=1 Tax=Bacillus solimangrovi TaxID=1305675 RepID=A0A1E5LDD6_9BACI|nr:ATP-binding protein [Bacillus solimangrovi]OEH92095.1 hypothetical protein BFG57_16840 [Bacillus solimangrovi]